MEDTSNCVDAMSSVVDKTEKADTLHLVESDLLCQTGAKAIRWFGRAATALYRAYTIAQRFADSEAGETEVILPSISCATPANAALLAGITPRFADVDPATGMSTLETIRARWTPKTSAVVFIHLFGQTADLRPVAEWCRSKNILLIEDLAQSLGGCLPDGSPVGSRGDLSVYSFNPTKILECGGGALLIRSNHLMSICDQLSDADPWPEELDADRASVLSSSYRNLHHSLVALLRTRAIESVSEAFLKLQPAFRRLYLRRLKDPAVLARAWSGLQETLRHRYSLAQLYDHALASGPWIPLTQWRNSGVCWRYSLLVDFPENLVTLSEAVRRDGFHVSNLYWPVNDFFRPDDRCPNADQFARRIVNLWVDQSVDETWVQNCAKSLLRNASKLSS